MSSAYIKQLRQDESRLHKEDVLSKALVAAKLGNNVSHRFLMGLNYCYNSFITFGVKQIPETSGLTDKPNPYSEFFELLLALSDRVFTGNEAREKIALISEQFDSDEWNDFLAPILRRDMRAGISLSTINKIVKQTGYEIPVFSCQLACDSTDRPEMKGIKRLEKKLDGVRVLMMVEKTLSGIEVISYSRNGKVFDNFTHIEDQIKNHYLQLVDLADHSKDFVSGTFSEGFVLDGEVVGNTFQSLMRQARRKANVQNLDSVYHVFDILPIHDFKRGYFNAQLSKRVKLLELMKPAFRNMDSVTLLSYIEVDLDTHEGNNQLERYARDMVNDGYEGIMIKNLDAPYVCDRTTHWLKWKPTITVDLQVVGVEEGTGRNAGRMGALVCEGIDYDKKIKVNVGSGYDDKFRAQVWADITNEPVSWKKKVKKEWVTMIEYPSGNNVLGRTVEIIADAITKNQDGTYSLRFPRFARFRDDK